MKKAKVYTRGGDEGTSQLLSVGRVSKDHPRLAAYGDTDELNSVIGLALACELAAPLPDRLTSIQRKLFVLGSQIAVPDPGDVGFPIPEITGNHTEQLEGWIDELDGALPPLGNFILPGGTPGAAHMHFARTVCRRCERHLQALNQVEPLPAPTLTFTNRLGDFLFVAARYENYERGVADRVWRSAREE